VGNRKKRSRREKKGKEKKSYMQNEITHFLRAILTGKLHNYEKLNLM
jgi:hypothetical protein